MPPVAPMQPQVEVLAALRAEYDTDAHFAPYWLEGIDGTVRDHGHRINKGALAVLVDSGLVLRFQVAPFDVDDPVSHAGGDDAVASDAWRAELDQLVEALPWPLSWYHTQRGARLLAELPEPVDKNTFVHWCTRFAAALAERGVVVDPATVGDWNRCYRLPRVHRKGRAGVEVYPEHLSALVAGQAVVFDPGPVPAPSAASVRGLYEGISAAGAGPSIAWPDEVVAGGSGDQPGRNVTLTSKLGEYRNRALQQRDLAIIGHRFNAAVCVPPLDDSEVERIAASVAGMEIHPPKAIRDRVIDEYERARQRVRDDARPEGELLGKLSELMPAALRRMERRAQGLDVPVPVPWPALADALRGGLWPGLYVAIGNTGTGKTQLALQIGLNAARSGHPVVYVSLELERMAVCARLLGLATETAWSDLYLGKDATALASAGVAAERLAGLDLLRVAAYQPFKFSVNTLDEVAQALREEWPEHAGGSVDGKPSPKSPLVILDYMQLVTDLHEDAHRMELRERIGRAAGHGRAIATTSNAAVLLLSSTARGNYHRLAGWKTTGNDPDPINFVTTEPNSFVGMGKESGEIEYFADGVFVLVQDRNRVRQETPDMQVGLAKFRSGKSAWVPLVFNGSRYISDPMPRWRRRPDVGPQREDTVEAGAPEPTADGVETPVNGEEPEFAIPD